MSATFIKVSGIGNLGRDPEMRYTPGGQPVCNFSVAATRTYMRGEEKVEETTWARITTWGKQAENCHKYLVKGAKVYFEGRLNPDENGSPRIWQKSDGTPGASFEITAEIVRFLSGRSESAAEESEQEEAIPF